MNEKIIENIKGMIKVYKDDDLVLFKYNMIVNSGRDFIQKILCDKFFNDTVNTTGVNNYSEHKFYRIYLGKSDGTTIATQNNTELGSLNVNRIYKNLYTSSNPIDDAIITVDYTERKIVFFMEILENDLNVFSDIFITINKFTAGLPSTNTNDEVLFSRAILNNLFIEANSSYKLEYTIFF